MVGAAAGWTGPGRPCGRKRRWASLIPRAAGRATGSCVHTRARTARKACTVRPGQHTASGGRTRPTAAAAARAARARCRAHSGPGWRSRPAASASTGTRHSAAAAPAPRSSAPLRSPTRNLSGHARGRLFDQASSFADGAAPAAWKPAAASSARHTSAPRKHDVPATILLILARLASNSLRARCGSAAGAADTGTGPWPSWPACA